MNRIFMGNECEDNARNSEINEPYFDNIDYYRAIVKNNIPFFGIANSGTKELVAHCFVEAFIKKTFEKEAYEDAATVAAEKILLRSLILIVADVLPAARHNFTTICTVLRSHFVIKLRSQYDYDRQSKEIPYYASLRKGCEADTPAGRQFRFIRECDREKLYMITLSLLNRLAPLEYMERYQNEQKEK